MVAVTADPSSKAQGYFTLACIALGMIAYTWLGLNDIWTSLLVGGVMGGVFSRPLFQLLVWIGSRIGAFRR
jgi:hypothetical protein